LVLFYYKNKKNLWIVFAKGKLESGYLQFLFISKEGVDEIQKFYGLPVNELSPYNFQFY